MQRVSLYVDPEESSKGDSSLYLTAGTHSGCFRGRGTVIKGSRAKRFRNQGSGRSLKSVNLEPFQSTIWVRNGRVINQKHKVRNSTQL